MGESQTATKTAPSPRPPSSSTALAAIKAKVSIRLFADGVQVAEIDGDPKRWAELFSVATVKAAANGQPQQRSNHHKK